MKLSDQVFTKRSKALKLIALILVGSLITLSMTAVFSMFRTEAMPDRFRVRKSITDVSSQERAAYVNAVKTLKNSHLLGSKISIYDQFVVTHVEAMGLMSEFSPTGPAAGADAAHSNDAFLPWHREYLREFEDLLRLVEPELTIPYWDWTDPNALNVILQDDFLGPNNGQGKNITTPDGVVIAGGSIQSGSFSKANGWVLDPDININPFTGQSFGSSLLRYVLGSGEDRYPLTQQEVNDVLDLGDYDSFIGRFRPALEGWIQVDDKGNQIASGPFFLHNYMHGVIGGGYFDKNTGFPVPLGTMSNIASSPYDPIFWLLHSNVDRLWAEWQANGHAGSKFYPASDQPYGHNLNDPMWPWDGGQSTPGNIGPGNLVSYLPHYPKNFIVRPADVLDFRKLGYRYDTTPADGGQEPQQGPPQYVGPRKNIDELKKLHWGKVWLGPVPLPR